MTVNRNIEGARTTVEGSQQETMSDHRNHGENSVPARSSNGPEERARLAARLDASLSDSMLLEDPKFVEWRVAARQYLNNGRKRKLAHSRKALAICCMVAVLASAWQIKELSKSTAQVQIISSPPDHTRTVRIADGSTIILDRRTRLSVQLSRDARTIVLADGQARFIVRPDRDRPFRVLVGDREVRATGTDFNVAAAPGVFATSLITGSVVVSLSSTQRSWLGLYEERAVKPLAVLAAGQQYLEEKSQAGRVQRFSLQEVTAWQQGRWILDRESLASAAATISRYSDIKIVVAGEQLRRATISGLFAIGDVASFTQTVTALFPEAEVRYFPDRILITPRSREKNTATAEVIS